MKVTLRLAALAAAVAAPLAAEGAPLFIATFDNASSSSQFNVTQVAGSADTVAFGYDYSAHAIPEAPSSPGGAAATRGLFLQANKPAPGGAGANNGINVTAASGGVSINFTQLIRARFDMWINIPAGETVGTTEQALFGINTDGAGVNSRTGATQTGADGAWYHLAGEGGYGGTSTAANSRDLVGYLNNAVPAGARLDNNEAPLPTLFPSPPAPLLGTPGNKWVQVVIEEEGSNVVMSLDGVDIFTFSNTASGSGSVFVGYQDPFSGSVGSTGLFAIFDNVVVEVVPEPSSLLLGAGCFAAALVRRRSTR